MISFTPIIKVLFFCLSPVFMLAQPIRRAVTLPWSGYTVCSDTLADAFAAAVNPAALPNLPGFAAGCYAENKFLVRELNLFSLSLAFNGKAGAFGMQARYFGVRAYYETMAGIAYAKDLGRINLGIQGNFHHFASPGWSARSLWSIEIGTLWKLSDRIHTAFHFIYPASLPGNIKNERIAYSLEMSLGASLSPEVYLSLQLIREEEQPVSALARIRYVFGGGFFATLGVSTATRQPAAGLGWEWGRFRVEWFSAYHLSLGPSPGLFLLYQPRKTKLT